MTTKAKGRGPSRRRKAQKPGLKATLHARLFERIPVTVSGSTRRATVLEAVMLQLLQKTAAGDAGARSLLLQYRELVARAEKPRTEIVFVDSDDVPATSAPQEGLAGGDV